MSPLDDPYSWGALLNRHALVTTGALPRLRVKSLSPCSDVFLDTYDNVMLPGPHRRQLGLVDVNYAASIVI